MEWSEQSARSVVRDNMWGVLLFAGVAWLAAGWSVLRLEPADIAAVAGPVILFGALTEAARAYAGTKTWWLNAGMAVLFAVTGCVLLAQQDTAYTAPAALIGWYLMVRGAADVAIATMSRGQDRIWGLVMVVGVLEAGLGFFAASPMARTADLTVVVLGGLGLLRGVADLVTGLRLREVAAVRTNVLKLSPERSAAVAGFSAGLADYESAPPAAPERNHPRHAAAGHPVSPAAAQPMWPAGPAATTAGAAGAGGMAAAGYTLADTDTFHDEVVRTTADLDGMLALAGVTGTGVSAHLGDDEVPEVPDTPEGAEPETRATEDRTAVDEASIIAGLRRLD